MRFFFGLAFGAIGMWAYQSGKLNELMGSSATQSVGNVWQPAAERIGSMANSDQIKQVALKVQDTVQSARGSDIVTPSPAEVAGRPSEPLPTPKA